MATGPDSPYANLGPFSASLFTPSKPQRHKTPLVKQLQVEDTLEHWALTVGSPGPVGGSFAREPSPSQLAPSRAASTLARGLGPGPGKEWRLEERRRSKVFLSAGAIEGSSPPPSVYLPSLQPSRSIEEHHLGAGHIIGHYLLLPSPVSALKPLVSGLGLRPSGSTFIHPLTRKPLDPSSPLALALAAQEWVLASQAPSCSPTLMHSPDADHSGPLFVNVQAWDSDRGTLASPAFSQRSPAWIPVPAQSKVEKDPQEERKSPEDKKSMILSVLDTSFQRPASLIVVHTTSNGQEPSRLGAEEERPSTLELAPALMQTASVAEPLPSPWVQPPGSTPADPGPGQGSSEQEPELVSTVNLPPAQLSSSDDETREELVCIGLVSPPEEFANGILLATPPPGLGPLPTTVPSLASGKPSSEPPPAPESAADSGVEEADTRSSSDPHLETTSTISTVSSMSTLSSESEELTNTHTSFADGCTFVLKKPPVPPKPKLKFPLGKGPTHSLTQWRVVQGRRKQFDVLLAEHKNKTREKESMHHLDSQPPPPPLRNPHLVPPRSSQEPHQSAHGVIPSESKPSVASKPKPHTPSLPRPPGCPAQQGGSAPVDPPPVHESPHPTLPATEPAIWLSSEGGEGDDKEESIEKLDCHYSGHHAQPASFCTFGSRQIGRGYYVFDSSSTGALNLMMEKHLKVQLWKKGLVGAALFLAPYLLIAGVNLRQIGTSSWNHSECTAGHLRVDGSCVQYAIETSVLFILIPFQALWPLLSTLLPHVQETSEVEIQQIFKAQANSTDCHNASSSASGSSGKKRKSSSPLLAHASSSSSSLSSSSHSMESFRKNRVTCPGPLYVSAVTSPHNIGLDCVAIRAHAAGLLHEQSGRGPLSGSPTESIKRMSVMVNNGGSKLSLGPFVHQSSELPINLHGGFPLSHSPMDRLIGKKRKCSPGSGGSGSKPTKVAKLPHEACGHHPKGTRTGEHFPPPPGPPDQLTVPYHKYQTD
ncbi:SH3 and multiple ankyrin repeat domains protein 3 [Sciurus carolinensis]|uniref:SH3 and multiple ankyrin repeat domains protein 3 n=1 Tax=Sciurus carolinensis TaxID=30640 RepID=A0AA41NCV3_SCICA|nr:SH3 and multiple ankyrin repeat domains protein 3 [Sciurus carolinensis]